MKKLLLILFLFISYTSFSQGKIGGEGNVIPTGNYPIVASKDIKGGLHKFQTIAERNALPANFKDSGMLGYVVDSLKYYKWNGATWEEFKTGADAPTDYFTSYTQASDSSYLQTNRKDGTKQYVVIQADGLTGGNSSGGITTSQLSDSLNNVTLQRAFDNSVANGDMPHIISEVPLMVSNRIYSLNEDGSAVGAFLPDGETGVSIQVEDSIPTVIFGYRNGTNTISPANLPYDNGFTWYLPSRSGTIAMSLNGQLADVNGNIKTIDSTVTLTSGTITVSDTRVKTGARIFLSVNTPSGTQGFLYAKTSDIVDGTSFIINSTSATDNSTVNYEIINP